MNCPLCEKEHLEQRKELPQFYNCNHCGCIFRDPRFYLSIEKERERYLLHENDVSDLGYQNYVKPLVDAVLTLMPQAKNGLDYGSGPGPVAAKMLAAQGYHLQLYDPFFNDNLAVLQKKYDYIICCEVMEHFHHPLKELKGLKKLLNTNGKLFCMTQLIPSDKDFKDWHYKNDPTHVIFYSKKTMHWIKEHLLFLNVSIQGRLTIFS